MSAPVVQYYVRLADGTKCDRRATAFLAWRMAWVQCGEGLRKYDGGTLVRVTRYKRNARAQAAVLKSARAFGRSFEETGNSARTSKLREALLYEACRYGRTRDK